LISALRKVLISNKEQSQNGGEEGSKRVGGNFPADFKYRILKRRKRLMRWIVQIRATVDVVIPIWVEAPDMQEAGNIAHLKLSQESLDGKPLKSIRLNRKHPTILSEIEECPNLAPVRDLSPS
jgi:hypothetical protein